MRTELNEAFGTPLAKRPLYAALRNPMLLRLGARIVRLGMEAIPVPLNVNVGTIPLSRLPRFNRIPFRRRAGGTIPAVGKRVARVIYFTGCATDLINEDVGEAVVKVLTHLGIEVLIPQDQVCCAAPIFLSGARRQALVNIGKNLSILDRGDVDAVVVDCATCGGALRKAIPHLLEDLEEDPEQARRVASKVRDVSEIVAERLDRLELRSHGSEPRVRVTYHDPCHLARSMKVSAAPRRLLAALEDLELKEMPGSDQCCGGAGAFQFEHREISAAVTGRKKQNIRSVSAHIVATGCPGCQLTLSGNLCEPDDPSVVHGIQLVAQRLRTRATHSHRS